MNNNIIFSVLCFVFIMLNLSCQELQNKAIHKSKVKSSVSNIDLGSLANEQEKEKTEQGQNSTSLTKESHKEGAVSSELGKKVMIPQDEVIEKLIKQGENQFNFLQNYDLEALDTYAPTLGEMDEYYKIFDEVVFANKWSVFQKNYEQQGTQFGLDKALDQDLIKKISCRMSVLRARSLSLTKERVKIDNEKVVLDTIYVTTVGSETPLYNIHIRYKKIDKEEYYEVVNEACWFTNRGCINNLGWRFLGKYIPHTGKYIDSELNFRNK